MKCEDQIKTLHAFYKSVNRKYKNSPLPVSEEEKSHIKKENRKSGVGVQRGMKEELNGKESMVKRKATDRTF